MKVQLVTDQGEVLREFEIPDNPTFEVIVWQHRAFVMGFRYGTGETPYIEKSTIDIGD